MARLGLPIVPANAVMAEEAVAVLFAPELVAVIRRWRIEARPIPPCALRYVEAMTVVERAVRACSAPGTGSVPRDPNPDSTAPTACTLVSVKTAAQLIGIGERGVRQRLKRGTLPGRLDELGRWQVLIAPEEEN